MTEIMGRPDKPGDDDQEKVALRSPALCLKGRRVA
jgi:hypothetical protein